jgi:hypothetical protein
MVVCSTENSGRLRQAGDLEVAALKDAGPGHSEVFKTAGTFRNRFLSRVEPRYEAATEVLDLSEGVRLTALVDYDNGGSHF